MVNIKKKFILNFGHFMYPKTQRKKDHIVYLIAIKIAEIKELANGYFTEYQLYVSNLKKFLLEVGFHPKSTNKSAKLLCKVDKYIVLCIEIRALKCTL